MELSEKQVHVCPICKKGHVNDKEFMKICQQCFREHELDLAFMDWAVKDSKMVEEVLDKHANKFLREIDEKGDKSLAKMKKINRVSRWYSRIYLLMMIYWIGYLVGIIIFG